MKEKKKNNLKCAHCGPIYTSHFGRWYEDLFYYLFFRKLPKIPSKLEKKVFGLFNWGLVKVRLLKLSDDVLNKNIFSRTRVFVEEAVGKGIKIKAYKSRWGFINHFLMEKNGKKYHFEGLPNGDEFSRYIDYIDDKDWVRGFLQKNDFPVVKGKDFWFFEKKKVLKWVRRNLEFPVIVKPSRSSMSQHVTMNVNDANMLKEGVRIALAHGPKFIIEKYLENKNVYRVNVFGFTNIAVAKRIPACVIGDGVRSIKELIAEKNSDVRRGEACGSETSLFKIQFDEVSERLLGLRGYAVDSVPEKDEIIYLQEKIILDIGADIENILLEAVHPDNQQLFLDLAMKLGVVLVGIDFLASDLKISWKEQECAIIELNSMPFIDIHHHPSIGDPINAGKMLADAVEEKYFGGV